MACSSLKPAAAALALQLRRRAPPTATAAASPAAALLLRSHRHMATSTTTTTQQRKPDGDGDDDNRNSSGGRAVGGGRVIENPPPGMAPLPEDAPPQTPPRLGEPDPFGPPLPTTSKDKLGGGGATKEGGRAPGGLPDTAPPPGVDGPPVSPDGRNV